MSQNPVNAPVQTRRQRFSGWFHSERAARDGLPSVRLLLALPALLLLFGILMVGTGLNGTSSGHLWGVLNKGADSALLAGQPEAIRSDEWNVGTVWSISQLAQGLPERNHAFPGGMDASLPYDLPRRDWSVAFRPHNIGYLFLSADQATAWKWWAPGLTLIAAAWAFLITILPRRPLVAAALAIGFYFSPFFQWWYQSTTFWPVAWGLATMAALTWAFKTSSTRSRWIWAVIVSYLTVVMAMGIYAPFIIPVVLVVVFVAIGLIIEALRHGLRVRDVGIRLLPTIVAGLVAGIVTLVWLRSKQSTVNAFLTTVYPGERLTGTGSGTAISTARTLGSSFARSLKLGDGFLGINASEASTFFLVGVFLVPAVIWIVVVRVRARAPLPWVLIALVGSLLLMAAFSYIPGWNAVAHLLFLDRTTVDRLRIGIGLASFALVGYLIHELDALGRSAKIWVSAIGAGVFLVSQLAIAAAVFRVMGAARLWGASPYWWLWALLSAGAIFLFARRRATLAAALFLVVTVASSITVNPLYHGVLDLRESAISKSIVKATAKDPGAWVGVGGEAIVTDLLLESGVTAYNGTQGAPSRKMWRQIDPTGKYETEWNRIGAVTWLAKEGAPVVQNPAPDQIQSTFDACSNFAKKHVAWVLSIQPIDSSCLVSERSFTIPNATITIYRVDATTAAVTP